jgi:hypothetical protein
MNSPAVTSFAPSAQPALELIALARLAPEQARKKLRSLLLANPNYFGKVPSRSFIAVLKIQEDTTYECISRIGYDPQHEQLCATIDIKQAFGYSGDAFIHGSEEFVRFYLSYDGGSTWLDQGMRSLSVFNAQLPRPLAHTVTLEVIPRIELCSEKFLARIRAVLSWNSPPPAGAPNWTPVWGNVVESETALAVPIAAVANPTISAPISAFGAPNRDRKSSPRQTEFSTVGGSVCSPERVESQHSV